ncbi:PREDICTED: alpha/beta hydrolase domain-containing protein 17A [Pygoscelis adeliae]|uniref:alpha/beta hydrolase domain-containing protein 17A n=1 Tax=Pygoscelis adeliae TaxID=9238 RepID=UPI0004F5064C|nr:PREDICTED: alpha/beta hydrolase domain-containing protein 17A [Pygoscelis adeliae]
MVKQQSTGTTRRGIGGAGRLREGSGVQGKAKGELWGTLKALGGLEHPKRHPEGSGTHTWRALGCRESQMLGSVALQKKTRGGLWGSARRAIAFLLGLSGASRLGHGGTTWPQTSWTNRGLSRERVLLPPSGRRETRYTVLFSHGNAVDLGQMSSFYIGLGTRINCNIFSYDYSGYGVSTGKPSERNLYSDIDAAWQALRTRYGISPENIILYGQSIGTVPTVDLASRYECAAIVLHSPLTSGMRVAFPETKKTYWFDAFPNIEKISKITSPVLIIHGTEDEVIDFSHGLALFERCPKAVEPLWVDGAGHNDIELYSQYLERLRKFISQELASQRN